MISHTGFPTRYPQHCGYQTRWRHPYWSGSG